MFHTFLHAPRGPFYSPTTARSHWRSTWKAILALLSSGAPDSPVHDLLPYLAHLIPWITQPTVGTGSC
jgi:hypothetical protein